MLIEADGPLRDAHRAALQSAGYHVVEGCGGEQAVRIVHQEHPCVLVMQCALPGVSGLRATEVLKDEPELQDVPVLLVGGEDGEDELRARRAGCDAFLAVPCRAEQLLKEVLWLTRSTQGDSRRRSARRSARGRMERATAEVAWTDERMRRTWGGLHRI